MTKKEVKPVENKKKAKPIEIIQRKTILEEQKKEDMIQQVKKLDEQLLKHKISDDNDDEVYFGGKT